MAKKTETTLDFGSKWDYSSAPESVDYASIKEEYG